MSLLPLKEATNRKGKAQTNYVLHRSGHLSLPPALLTGKPGSTENQQQEFALPDSQAKSTKRKQLTLEELGAKRFAAHFNRDSVSNDSSLASLAAVQ